MIYVLLVVFIALLVAKCLAQSREIHTRDVTLYLLSKHAIELGSSMITEPYPMPDRWTPLDLEAGDA